MAWRPTRRMPWWVLGAFALGIAVFFLVIRGRGEEDFFRADSLPPSAAQREYAPLPAPLPAGSRSGLERAEASAGDAQAVVVEEEPEVVPPPPPPPPRDARPDPVEAISRQARPLPGRTPPPEYPRRALMRGEGGTALVIVHVGPDGVPTATQLAQSSGSRELDRAAQSAVRRWRFEPALDGGRPAVGRVVVPIDFRPGP